MSTVAMPVPVSSEVAASPKNRVKPSASEISVQSRHLIGCIQEKRSLVFELIDHARAIIETPDANITLNSYYTTLLNEHANDNGGTSRIIDPSKIEQALITKFDTSCREYISSQNNRESLETFLENLGFSYSSNDTVSPAKNDRGMTNGRYTFSNGVRKISSEFFFDETKEVREGLTPKYLIRCIKHIAHIAFLQMSYEDKIEYLKHYMIPNSFTDGTLHHMSPLWIYEIINADKFEDFMDRAGYIQDRGVEHTKYLWKLKPRIYMSDEYFWTRGNYNHTTPIDVCYNTYNHDFNKIEAATIMAVWRRLQTSYISTAMILSDMGFELSESSAEELGKYMDELDRRKNINHNN